MTPMRLLSFCVIWLAIAIYVANALRSARQQRRIG